MPYLSLWLIRNLEVRAAPAQVGWWGEEAAADGGRVVVLAHLKYILVLSLWYYICQP